MLKILSSLALILGIASTTFAAEQTAKLVFVDGTVEITTNHEQQTTAFRLCRISGDDCQTLGSKANFSADELKHLAQDSRSLKRIYERHPVIFGTSFGALAGAGAGLVVIMVAGPVAPLIVYAAYLGGGAALAGTLGGAVGYAKDAQMNENAGLLSTATSAGSGTLQMQGSAQTYAIKLDSILSQIQ